MSSARRAAHLTSTAGDHDMTAATELKTSRVLERQAQVRGTTSRPHHRVTRARAQLRDHWHA
jgi:hypothetical protein